jgi:hypothetical protein
MRGSMKAWLAGVALGAATLAGVPAQAVTVTETYRVTGSGFDDLLNLAPAPFSSAEVVFSLNFDRALQYNGATDVITLVSSTLPLSSALALTYSPVTQTIFVGGSSAGTAGFTLLADDFSIVANIANAASPTGFTIGYTTAATPGSLFATFATITAVPEPAAWIMMIFGFGAAGMALRRGERRPRLARA